MFRQEEIGQFHQDGFIVVKHLIPGKELLRLQEAASRITAEGVVG